MFTASSILFRLVQLDLNLDAWQIFERNLRVICILCSWNRWIFHLKVLHASRISTENLSPWSGKSWCQEPERFCRRIFDLTETFQQMGIPQNVGNIYNVIIRHLVPLWLKTRAAHTKEWSDIKAERLKTLCWKAVFECLQFPTKIKHLCFTEPIASVFEFIIVKERLYLSRKPMLYIAFCPNFSIGLGSSVVICSNCKSTHDCKKCFMLLLQYPPLQNRDYD